MSSRTLEGWVNLEDPENVYENDADKPLSGRVYLRLKWNSEALLPGSMRKKTRYVVVKTHVKVLETTWYVVRGTSLLSMSLYEVRRCQRGTSLSSHMSKYLKQRYQINIT